LFEGSAAERFEHFPQKVFECASWDRLVFGLWFIWSVLDCRLFEPFFHLLRLRFFDLQNLQGFKLFLGEVFLLLLLFCWLRRRLELLSLDWFFLHLITTNCFLVKVKRFFAQVEARIHRFLPVEEGV